MLSVRPTGVNSRATSWIGRGCSLMLTIAHNNRSQHLSATCGVILHAGRSGWPLAKIDDGA